MSSDTDGFDMAELSRRVEMMKKSEEQEQYGSETGENGSSNQGQRPPRYRKLMAIAFDALLPGQQLEGQTTDPNFMQVLRDHVGLGGTFVMISVNPFKRKLRRNGVLCRVDFMNAKYNQERFLPTAIDFVITASTTCRLVGPSDAFRSRVGRWRRCYDPDGEESRLGWGDEPFLDAIPEGTSNDLPVNFEGEADSEQQGEVNLNDQNQPNLSWIDCEVPRQEEISDEVRQMAHDLIPLLEKWERLASDVTTYDNTDVVATSRLAKGMPGLRIDPAAVMRLVKKNLGAMPNADDDPNALALWAAALVNPLPPMGISPEIRGLVLEAATTKERLRLATWGTERSIRNLEGTDPLV